MKSQIEYFKQHLINQAKSNNTIRNYTSDVTHYFNIFNTINRNNIQLYKSKLSHLSAKTINLKLSALKSFNEYLLGKGLIDSIFIIKADFIKIQSKGNPTNVTEKQVSNFLNNVSDKPNIYKSRNIAIIYLIANTGIRREEITNLKLKGLNLENGELVVLGKGNKERTVYLNDVAIQVIKDYLIDRMKHKYFDSEYLFLSERSKKLHKDSINYIFGLYGKNEDKVGVHQLRHSFATSAIEQDILTLPELQDQLGHGSLQVTSMYTHARKENIKKKINNLRIGL